MADTAHLEALSLRLSHEKARLAAAKTDGERELRGVWVAQLEREIAAERAHLGMDAAPEAADMTDDQLLAALTEPPPGQQ